MASPAASKWTTRLTSSTWIPRAATSVATTTCTAPWENRSRFRSRTRWGEAALEVDRGQAAFGQCLRDLSRALAGAGEDDRAAVGLDQTGERLHLVAEAADGQRVVRHGGHRPRVGVELVHPGVAQVRTDEQVDVAVEGGAEQQPLAGRRRQPDELVDGRVEAEVAEVVRLVEDGHLDVVEEEVPVLEQVLQAAGGRHDQVGALPELSRLLLVRRAAVDRGELRPTAAASGWSERATWLASSRVGTTTRARGWHGRDLRPDRRDRIGSPKARVLPEPVRARPSTSQPATASGRTAACTGVGSVMPCSASADMSSAGSSVKTDMRCSSAFLGDGRCPITGLRAPRAHHRA